MAKKYRDRWRETTASGVVQRQMTFDTKAERDAHAAKRALGQVVRKGSNLLFSDLGEIWLNDHCKHNKAAGQFYNDRQTIVAYLNPAFGDVRLSELTYHHLNNLKHKLMNGMRCKGRSKGNLKPKSVNNIIALAKAMCKLATETGEPTLLPANPFQNVKMMKVNKQPSDYWNEDERDRFLRFCKAEDPEFAELVMFASHTGLRRSEMAGLMRRHLNFELRLIEVSEIFCFRMKSQQARTKNRLVAYVPMGDAVYEALKDRQLAKMDSRVFDTDAIMTALPKLKKYAVKFGVKPIRWHDLRHTFASILAMRGVNIFDIKKLLRHETIEMTMRYAHLSPDHLLAAVNKLCAPSVRDDSETRDNLLKLQG